MSTKSVTRCKELCLVWTGALQFVKRNNKSKGYSFQENQDSLTPLRKGMNRRTEKISSINPFFIDHVELFMLLTTQVENVHGVSHLQYATFSTLNYAKDFAQSVKWIVVGFSLFCCTSIMAHAKILRYGRKQFPRMRRNAAGEWFPSLRGGRWSKKGTLNRPLGAWTHNRTIWSAEGV